MGNCSLRSLYGREDDPVRIMTDSGGIMQLKGPISVDSVVKDFPGYGISRQGDVLEPLRPSDQLLNGCSYYLFPHRIEPKDDVSIVPVLEQTVPEDPETGSEPVAESPPEPTVEVLPPKWEGVWRVKLVVSPEQLAEIFSQQANTEAMIEKMRMAAKAGPSGEGQLSRSSSRRSIKSLISGSSGAGGGYFN
ncbi:hypothetical protein EJ110_NYTH24844 [Nymphaea thermarum]|nr:hypothetical protein EJ110_NYTH24844 [Nymphaea thermarum]